MYFFILSFFVFSANFNLLIVFISIVSIYFASSNSVWTIAKFCPCIIPDRIFALYNFTCTILNDKCFILNIFCFCLHYVTFSVFLDSTLFIICWCIFNSCITVVISFGCFNFFRYPNNIFQKSKESFGFYIFQTQTIQQLAGFSFWKNFIFGIFMYFVF